MVGNGARRHQNGRRRLRRKREYDEDDVRVRPGRSSRPRTRTRPRHDDAVDAMVITVDRGRYGCVRTDADTEDDDTTPEGRLERVVVANADQLVIVSSLADPPPRTGFIDRCLVAAYDAEIDALLCLTKADLAGPGPGPAPGRARRPDLGTRRPFRCRQVHAGEPARAGRRPGGRRGQRDRQ